MQPGNLHIARTRGQSFEDTIDGYFPLQVSLSQMLTRLEFDAAFVWLRLAPILDVPDLPTDAPVPLNVGAGRGGLIVWLTVHISRTDGIVSGAGRWQWLDGLEHEVLSPMTRLAEPVFVEGIGLGAGAISRPRTFARIEARHVANATLDTMGWSAARAYDLGTQTGRIVSGHAPIDLPVRNKRHRGHGNTRQLLLVDRPSEPS